MAEYKIEKLSKKDFSLLIPLMKDCFGSDVDLNYFNWKYLDNPSGEFVGFVALSENGEVAAFYGVIPHLFIVEGEKAIFFQACDAMTHPDHRQKGLFNKLVSHCCDYLENENKLFVIAFGGSTSSNSFLRMGWSKIFNMRYYFIPKTFNFLTSTSEDNQIEFLENYELIEEAISSSNKSESIHSFKSLEIFNWRLSNPKFDYKVISSKVLNYDSFISYYINNNKIIIFDFFIKNRKSGKKLFGHLKALLKASNCQGIIAYCQENSSFSKDLFSYGFISNPFKKGPLSYKPPFVFYSSKENMSKYKNKSNWLMSAFDHDAM